MPLTFYSTIFLYRVQAITGGSQNNFTLFLYFLTRSTYRILIISIVMMILFVGSNLYPSRINSQQLEATMYMNQYRLGSKTLTTAVQPYAVTGDKTYYNNMKELHEDKNCDIAWESLQQDGLTDNEWEEINHIAEISEILRAYRRICRWLRTLFQRFLSPFCTFFQHCNLVMVSIMPL